jgi:hypothetical protein
MLVFISHNDAATSTATATRANNRALIVRLIVQEVFGCAEDTAKFDTSL